MDQLEDQDGITAYHGSPHDFDQFDISKVGTGEGSQSYGHGLYFSDLERAAQDYRDRLGGEGQTSGSSMADYFAVDRNTHKFMSEDDVAEHLDDIERKAYKTIFEGGKHKYLFPDNSILVDEGDHFRAAQKQKGRVYEVNINAHPDHFLDWDKPLQQQPYVMEKLMEAGVLNADGDTAFMYNDTPRRGGDIYERLTSPLAKKLTGGETQKHASEFLHQAGIKGIRYNDNRSTNYVVFDDKLVTTKRKYARGGIVNA